MSYVLVFGGIDSFLKSENNLERNFDPTNIAVERTFGIDSFIWLQAILNKWWNDVGVI